MYFDVVVYKHFSRLSNKAVMVVYTLIPCMFQVSSLIVYETHEDTVTDEEYEQIYEKCPETEFYGLFEYWQFIPICAFPLAIYCAFLASKFI